MRRRGWRGPESLQLYIPGGTARDPRAKSPRQGVLGASAKPEWPLPFLFDEDRDGQARRQRRRLVQEQRQAAFLGYAGSFIRRAGPRGPARRGRPDAGPQVGVPSLQRPRSGFSFGVRGGHPPSTGVEMAQLVDLNARRASTRRFHAHRLERLLRDGRDGSSAFRGEPERRLRERSLRAMLTDDQASLEISAGFFPIRS